MTTARDKFWMFGVRAHQDDIWLGKRRENRDRVRSRITPAEGAFMLGIPNMLMINCDGIPVPFSEDAAGYAESFRPMKRVLWGAMGSGGFRIGNEEAYICELAEKYPNIAGAYLDDVFGSDTRDVSQVAEFLRGIRSNLDKACRPMELWVTWYTHEMWAAVPEVFDNITGITQWTWNYGDLPDLVDRFEVMEKTFPKHKKLLGIYMYDFPSGLPVPLDLMAFQCEQGLNLMREGRLDGMIFEANSVMGVGLPSERWLIEWIERIGDTKVPL
jgi:hypothetical protein